MEHVGLVVNRLIRISYGPFRLGDLAAGAVEEVKPKVVREQLGLAAPKRAEGRTDRRPVARKKKPAKG
jgi:23S rRNA pseudouridine2605 synthase